MNRPLSLISPNRGIKVATIRQGVTKQALLVWIPDEAELSALEQRHSYDFGTGDVSIDTLSEALVSWRQSNEDAVLTSASWEPTALGLRIPAPVVAQPSGSRTALILEGHESIAALLAHPHKHRPAQPCQSRCFNQAQSINDKARSWGRGPNQ